MLALQERVAQQFATQQQPAQQSSTADAARMWQQLLLGSTGYTSSQPQTVGRGLNANLIPNENLLQATGGNSLLDLSSVFGNLNGLAAASSLSAFGFQNQQQHPLYQNGICTWPQCSQVTLSY